MTLDIETFDVDISGGTGLDIIIGAASDGALIDFTLTATRFNSVMVAFVVGQHTVYQSEDSDTWTKAIDGVGDDGLFLYGFTRTSDYTEEAIDRDIVPFGSLEADELQGAMVVMNNAVEGTAIGDVTHVAFVDDSAPPSPAVISTSRRDVIIGVCSVDGAHTLTAPEGCTVLATISSSEVSTRTTLVVQRVAGGAGEIDIGAFAADGEVTGRTWAVCLKHTQLAPRVPASWVGPWLGAPRRSSVVPTAETVPSLFPPPVVVGTVETVEPVLSEDLVTSAIDRLPSFLRGTS